MMEAASTSKASLNLYQTTRRNNPKKSHLHFRRVRIWNLTCRLVRYLLNQGRIRWQFYVGGTPSLSNFETLALTPELFCTRKGPCLSHCLFWIFVSVVMHKEKEDGMHHDSQFRNRDLTTYDHTLLDGEMFLQVCHYAPCLFYTSFRLFSRLAAPHSTLQML
jgi:hypothetical protein